MSHLDRWAKIDEKIGGEFTVKTLQCDECIHKQSNPMICEEYPERKPNCVLRVECDCPKFEPKR